VVVLAYFTIPNRVVGQEVIRRLVMNTNVTRGFSRIDEDASWGQDAFDELTALLAESKLRTAEFFKKKESAS